MRKKAESRLRLGTHPAAQRAARPEAGTRTTQGVFTDVGHHEKTPLGAAGPMATAQLRLAEAIQSSPRMIAQLERIEAVSGGGALQRRGAEGEGLLQGQFAVRQRGSPDLEEQEEKPIQGQFPVRQRGSPDLEEQEEKPIQGKFAPLQRVLEEEGKTDSPPNRTGLPDKLKVGIESLSGMDMSDVHVHTNSSKPAEVQAEAYAQGQDIHLGAGQERHLPHEAWHVVQQRQGRVKPTLQLQGIAVNDDPALEHEADVMGREALKAGS